MRRARRSSRAFLGWAPTRREGRVLSVLLLAARELVDPFAEFVDDELLDVSLFGDDPLT